MRNAVPYHPLRPILMVLLLALMLPEIACHKDPYQDQPVNNELVILAEITAGDSVKIPVSKSIQVGNGGIISFEKVNSASVKLAREDGKSWTLKLNTSPDYAANPASIYSAPQKPRFNTTYTLQVQDPLSGTVISRTTIPPPVHVKDVDTATVIRNGSPMLRLRFTLVDSPGANHHFVFEALKEGLRKKHHDTISSNSFQRLNVFTEDGNVDNAQVSSLDSPFRRIFLPGRIFNGFYTTSVLVDRKYFKAGDPHNPGRVLLQLKSVSAELYNYLFWYEKYRSDIGSVPPGQLYSPPGNIQHGLGIFGGSSRRQWVYYFDPLK